MKTIDEIRARVGEHEECLVILRQPHDPKSKEQRATDDRRMSPEAYQIAVALLAEVDTLTTLAYKVCIGHVSLEQHAAHVDELKAYLTKDAYEND